MREYRIMANVWKNDDRVKFMPTFTVEASSHDMAKGIAKDILDPWGFGYEMEMTITNTVTQNRTEWSNRK